MIGSREEVGEEDGGGRGGDMSVGKTVTVAVVFTAPVKRRTSQLVWSKTDDWVENRRADLHPMPIQLEPGTQQPPP